MPFFFPDAQGIHERLIEGQLAKTGRRIVAVDQSLALFATRFECVIGGPVTEIDADQVVHGDIKELGYAQEVFSRQTTLSPFGTREMSLVDIDLAGELFLAQSLGHSSTLETGGNNFHLGDN